MIFRPGIVVGRGGHPVPLGRGRLALRLVSRLWGDGKSALPIVLVDDCAEAMVRVRQGDGAGRAELQPGGRAAAHRQEYLDELERCAGIKVRRLPVPAWRRFVEDIAKYGLKTIAGSERNLPSYAYYVGLSNRARYSPEKTKQRLGWRPRGELAQVVDEGIAAPVAEYNL